MSRVAIVVVTHESGSVIGKCLDAIRQTEDSEIVVVDNASGDATSEEVARRKILLIANSRNESFAAAVNQGVRATSSPLILLLNPDAILKRGLNALISCFDDPLTGAAGGLLTDAAGVPQAGFTVRSLPTPAALILEALGINRLWPRNPVNWHYRCWAKDLATPQLVEQPAGAFLMFSREAWEKVGGFDERFCPIWFEDVDFCARLRKAGLNVWFHPLAVAEHEGGHSIRPLPLEIRQRYWYGSLLKYAEKHFSSLAYRAVCAAVATGSAVRGFAGIPRSGLKNIPVYSSVCGLALGRLLGRRRS